MGNLEVKEKFNNHNAQGAEKLTLTPAVLFERELISTILTDMLS